MTRLLVVSPVRDEAAHIAEVVASVRAQSRPPDRWLIVDDGSADGTAAAARAAAAGAPWIEVLQAPPAPAGADRLAAAAEARAFNWALAQAPGEWDLIAKLDGDMLLAADHFERVLAAMEADPRLGIAGTYMDEMVRGRRRLSPHPAHHVHGALKVYRRACFDAVGGIENRLAWDTIDEVRARMLGWRTHSLMEPRPLHLRVSGSAQGALRGRARHGTCAWILHTPPPIVALTAARLLGVAPRGLASPAYVWGYVSGPLRRVPRVADPGFREFVRAEQYARLRGLLRRRRRR